MRKTQLGPGSTHGNRPRRAAATRGLKKTQLGPGSTQRTDSGGAAMKWGRTDRPADQPQDGPVRDAARPGSYVGNVLGCCAREAASPAKTLIADRRVVKLRPVPQEPCRRREEPASVQGALRPGCPRGRSERRSNRCECVLRGGHRESEAQSFRSDPWAAVRRAQARSYAAGPGFGGRESSRFLGTKRWKKPETASIIARTSDRREGPGRGNRPPTPKLLAPT